MKKIFFSFLAVLLFSNLGYAQTAQVNQNLNADSAAVKKTALDYVEAFYNSAPEKVADDVHADSVKRIIYKDESGNIMIQNMGASGVTFSIVRNKKNDPDPSVPFKATVTICDIFNDTATVKIVTNKFNFIDYAHLAKVNGSWKIINFGH